MEKNIIYKIITSKYYEPFNENQCKNLNSSVVNTSWLYSFLQVSYTESFYSVKSRISFLTNLPFDTIVDFNIYCNTYVDEYKNYTKYNPLSPYENFISFIGESNFKNIIYIYVDISLNDIFYRLNQTQTQNDNNKKYLQEQINSLNKEKDRLNSQIWENNNLINSIKSQHEEEKNNLISKNYELENNLNSLKSTYESFKAQNESKVNDLYYKNREIERKHNEEKKRMNQTNRELQKNIQSLESEKNSMKSQYKELRNEYETTKNKVENLTVKNSNLTRKLEEEENRKVEEKKNQENYKSKFRKEKEIIQNKNISNSKNYIIHFIINKFYKGFEKEENKKDKFTKSLEKCISELAKDFMEESKNFRNNFKENSQKIIKNYNVKDNNIQINHINFCVIGNAGTGKSTLINQILQLPEHKKAKVGNGMSVTKKSELYFSEKLKNIAMWDTPGLDRIIKPEDILKEVKRLVDEGIEKGPDHYINIILYCTIGQRFQIQDGEFIRDIMKLYPMDNLPVIITQLQAYFEDDAKDMEINIRKILSEYLENHIEEKIQIISVVSKDKIVRDKKYEAYGIPELLRCSIDLMERAVTSATFKKFSQDIEELCKNYVEEKKRFVDNITKDEIEILDIAKEKFSEEWEKYFDDEENNKNERNLSKYNIYKNINESEYFTNNFVELLTNKFLMIFNNLNNTKNTFENKNRVVIIFQTAFDKIKDKLTACSDGFFNEKYETIYEKFFKELRKQQSLISKEFNTTNNIIDESEIEKSFKPELKKFFKNEFFKYFFCIIIKVFIKKLKEILISNYKKELKENEVMTKIINQKAEYSLKIVTERLRQQLLKDIDFYFPKKVEKKNKEDDLKDQYIFDFN